MLQFLKDSWKKTYIIQVLIIFFSIIYFQFNPLLADITFEEFQSLGIVGVDKEMFDKFQNTDDPMALIPMVLELKDSFNMDSLPEIIEQLPFRTIIILLKRLVSFFLLVDFPAHCSLYCFLTLFLAFLFNHRKIESARRWNDHFKLYTSLLCVLLVAAVIIFFPLYLKYVSFNSMIASKTQNIADCLGNGEYFGLLGMAGEAMAKANDMKNTLSVSEKFLALVILVLFNSSIFLFGVIQRSGFSLENVIIGVKMSYKYKIKSLPASAVFLFVFWLLMSTGYIIFTIIYAFLAIQLFSCIMFQTVDIVISEEKK